MADAESSVRQRKPDASESPLDVNTTSPAKISKKAQRTSDGEEYSPWIDVLRVLTFLFIASCGLSYLISSGESYFWGMSNSPDYLRPAWWKSKWSGPIYLTPEQLAQYDGTDESKPIYLSINGSIYDVTAGRRIYGPGGSYNIFAGVDASRGFVTGCFKDDRNGDMRGVEEMYLPLDDAEVDKHWTAEAMRELKKKELAEAKKKAYDALKHWTDFFAKSKKYPYVGKLKRKSNWQGEWKTLCKVAQDGRVPRQIPKKEGES